jgi:hypothetical protein
MYNLNQQSEFTFFKLCDYYNVLMGSRPAANPRYLKSGQVASFF